MSDIASYNDAVLLDTPDWWLSLDPTTLLTDLSGNNHPGTGAGGITIGGAAGPGDALGATTFDGVDDRVTTGLAYGGALNRTFEIWAYRTNTAAVHTLLAGDSGGSPLDWRLASGSQDVQFLPTSGATAVWTAAFPGNTQWVHLMLDWVEATRTATLFVNSVSKGAVTLAAGNVLASATGNLEVGAKSGTTTPFSGRLAHPAIYSGAARGASSSLRHWSWGISTAASRNPNYGLPSATNFPSPNNTPTGDNTALTVR